MTKIDIIICTFRRAFVENTMHSVNAIERPAGSLCRMVIVDNDESPSARPLVEQVTGELSMDVAYIHAPARNISIARNAGLDAAEANGADWLAFVDDDEIVEPNWLVEMMAAGAGADVTAVFGYVNALYPPETPNWIHAKDYHTAVPEIREGKVRSGYSGNVLIRMADPALSGQRFLETKGRTGGEDVEFFYRVFRAGGQYAICNTLCVSEQVPPERLTFEWLKNRKYRAGLTYGRHFKNGFTLLSGASHFIFTSLKLSWCFLRAGTSILSQTERNFWLLRAAFHAGSIAAVLGRKEVEHY